MYQTPREKALESDLCEVALRLHRLREYMYAELKRDYSMLPSNFWESVFQQLGDAQYDTDVEEYFPTKSNTYHE